MNVDTRFEPWIDELLSQNNCTDIMNLPYGVIVDEIEDTEYSIANERLWSLGANTLIATEMHLNNAEALNDYKAMLINIREQQEKEQIINENKNNPHGKDIRFINSDYEELFKIPDGGYITIIRENGEQLIRKCDFMDECHTSISGHTYHICQFAEMMERSGNTYKPCPTPEKIAGYMITDRIPVNNKEVVMAHNPVAASPYVTWVRHTDFPDYEIGHYWSDKSIARNDFLLRAESERTGKPYDHTKLIKQNETRDKAR